MFWLSPSLVSPESSQPQPQAVEGHPSPLLCVYLQLERLVAVGTGWRRLILEAASNPIFLPLEGPVYRKAL